MENTIQPLNQKADDEYKTGACVARLDRSDWFKLLPDIKNNQEFKLVGFLEFDVYIIHKKGALNKYKNISYEAVQRQREKHAK